MEPWWRQWCEATVLSTVPLLILFYTLTSPLPPPFFIHVIRMYVVCVIDYLCLTVSISLCGCLYHTVDATDKNCDIVPLQSCTLFGYL